MNDVREGSPERGPTGLPGGAAGQSLPFLLLAGGAFWLRAHWAEVPARVPMHWGVNGQVDRFVDRSPLAVGLPLLLGAALCAILLLFALVLRNSPRHAFQKPSLRLVLAGELFIAAVCWGVVMASATGGRLLLPVLIFAGFATIALFGLTAGLFAGLRNQAPERNPSARRALFYSDPQDPALFVPKRRGYGYTINFGHPAALPVTLLLLLLPLAAGIAAVLVR